MITKMDFKVRVVYSHMEDTNQREIREHIIGDIMHALREKLSFMQRWNGGRPRAIIVDDLTEPKRRSSIAFRYTR